MYAIRLRSSWRGEVDNKPVEGQPGDILEVDRITLDGLCNERQKADPLTLEEYEAYLFAKKAPEKLAGTKAAKTKVQANKADKMVRTAANRAV